MANARAQSVLLACRVLQVYEWQMPVAVGRRLHDTHHRAVCGSGLFPRLSWASLPALSGVHEHVPSRARLMYSVRECETMKLMEMSSVVSWRSDGKQRGSGRYEAATWRIPIKSWPESRFSAARG